MGPAAEAARSAIAGLASSASPTAPRPGWAILRAEPGPAGQRMAPSTGSSSSTPASGRSRKGKAGRRRTGPRGRGRRRDDGGDDDGRNEPTLPSVGLPRPPRGRARGVGSYCPLTRSVTRSLHLRVSHFTGGLRGRCALRGGTFIAMTRPHGRGCAHFYGCAYPPRGATICPNTPS